MEGALLQAGIAGVVLAWFMLRAETIWNNLIEGQNRHEAAINRLAKAQMLSLIAREDTPQSVKQLAQDLSREIEEAETERKEIAKLRQRRSSPPRSSPSV